MKEESFRNLVIKNSFWNFFTVLLGKIGGLIFIVILARFLLPERFGIYNLVISVTFFLLIMIDMGINRTLIRYVSEAIGKNKKKIAIARYKYLLKIKLLLALVFSLMLFILAYPLSFYVFNKPELFLLFMLSSVYLFFSSIESFYESFFYIIEKVNYLVIRQVFLETLRIVGVLLVFIFIVRQYQIMGIIGVLILTKIFVLIFLIYYLKKLEPFLFDKSDIDLIKKDKKRILKFLFYVSFGGGILVTMAYVDTIMIGIFLPAEFVGFYSAAMAIVLGIALLLNIPNILTPIFVQFKKQRIERAFNDVFKFTALLTIPMVFGSWIFGKYVIKLIYGEEYLPAVLPFYLLAILIFEFPVIKNIYSLFSAAEKPKYMVNVAIVATLMNVLLNYLLITTLMKFSMSLAIIGAAAATLVSNTFYLSGLIIFAKKKLDIKIRLIHLIKPLISSLVMSGALLFVNLFILDMNIIIVILEIIFGMIIYFFVMFLLKGFTRDDFIILVKSLPYINKFKVFRKF